MSILSFAAAAPSAQRTSAVAQELVQRYHTLGETFPAQTLSGMRLSVARGYVRSKLGGVLRRDLVEVAVPPQVDPVAFREEILDRALESLTQLILGKMLKQNRLKLDRKAG
ncbi:MAG: hypothetical protein QM811_29170 [Pirellulales bacterium]